MQNSLHNISLTSPQKLDFSNLKKSTNNDSIHFIDNDDDDETDDNNKPTWSSRPDIWKDDVRMNALFAPFRNRDLNPLHYDNKLKFWKEAIKSYCTEKQILQFDLKYLENCFIRNNIKPKCLELALNELLKDKSISTRDEVLRPRSGLISNIFNKLVWSPIAWSTSYLFKTNTTTSIYSQSYVLTSPKSSSILESSFSKPQSSPVVSKDDQYDKTFVLFDLVESRSQEVLKFLQSNIVYLNVDCVFEYDKLITSFRDKINEKDLELVLKYLEINQRVLIIDSEVSSQKLIKFSSNNSQNVDQLTEVELSYLKLKETERKLEFEADRLSSQIESLNIEIKNQLKLGNKNSALKLLKKRKQIEKSLDAKDGVLNNIETMIMSIQQADTNKVTLDVYTKGVNALKEANKGVNLDQIDDTMYEIQDIYNQNSEIEDALGRSPVSSKYNLDEKELNAELNELLAEEASFESKEAGDGSFNMDDVLKFLPAIPNDTPNKLISTSSKSSYLS